MTYIEGCDPCVTTVAGAHSPQLRSDPWRWGGKSRHPRLLHQDGPDRAALPLAWLMTGMGKVPDGFDASRDRPHLVPVTLGNIGGGAGLVGAVYWTIYRAAFGEKR